MTIPSWKQSVVSIPNSGTIIPMHIKRSTPSNRLLVVLFTTCAAAGFSTNILAWGHDGHAAVGVLALGQLSIETRFKLEHVLGSVDDPTILEACNWPDVVRETAEWEWSAPQHYINIPPGENNYLKSRDCPDQLCATEAIKKYANALGDPQADTGKRQQAFAWLCHLVGDLHQPLHAGFTRDRGGNDFDVTYEGEQMNLHDFWDRALIEDRAGDWQDLIGVVSKFPTVQTADNWTPLTVDRWTEESHRLVQQELYPASTEVTQRYADKSWSIIQQRIITAASRLASIIESVL